MKRKTKKSLSQSQINDDDSDDDSSIASSSIAASSVGIARTASQMSQLSVEESPSSMIFQIIDDLEDKRTSNREGALAKLSKLLCHKFLGNEIGASDIEVLVKYLIRSLKKDGSECMMASKCLGQMALTFGPNPTLYKSCRDALVETIKSLSDQGKISSIKCLGVMSLVEDLDDHSVHELLGKAFR